ncbi:unnamed protein product [Discosporangium mesarthrocarpum]
MAAACGWVDGLHPGQPRAQEKGDVFWVTSASPKMNDVNQVAPFGFSSSGDRFMRATLSRVTAPELDKEDAAVEGRTEVALLVVESGALTAPANPCPIEAAYALARGRLASPIPIAVAVSIDSTSLKPSAVQDRLLTARAKLASLGVPMVPVTPWGELWLLQQEQEGGRVSYCRGSSHFTVRPGFEQVMNKKEVDRARLVFDICGGTGILRAISEAVVLRPPSLVFPVCDFSSLQSLGWEGKDAPCAPLRDCLLFRSCSTANDLVTAQKRRGVLRGDLVKAEIAPATNWGDTSAGVQKMDLETPIGAGAWLVHLEMTQKPRAAWGPPANVGAKGKPLASVKFGDLRIKDRRRKS